MSEKITLQERLLNAQEELKAPKGQYNSFGKYKYRSAEDILEAVKPINKKHGLLLVLYDEPVFIGDWHYIKATAEITDTNNEQTYKVTAYAREPENKKGMDHSQITGTASSYARKYALNGLYLIDDTKDADTDEYQNQNNNQQQNNNGPQMASDKQRNFVSKLIRDRTPDKEGQLQVFNVMLQALKLNNDMQTWTSQQASQAIKYLQGE